MQTFSVSTNKNGIRESDAQSLCLIFPCDGLVLFMLLLLSTGRDGCQRGCLHLQTAGYKRVYLLLLLWLGLRSLSVPLSLSLSLSVCLSVCLSLSLPHPLSPPLSFFWVKKTNARGLNMRISQSGCVSFLIKHCVSRCCQL